MITWREETFGKYGNKWIGVVGPIALVAIYVRTFLPKYSSMPVLNTILAAVVLLFPAAWAVFYTSQAINVLQEITLDADCLSGKCYFGRQLNCVASDIKSLSYYPMTWKIRYINFFDSKKPGINIELKNGDLFRINAKTEGFSSLIDALKVFSKTANGMRCDL